MEIAEPMAMAIFHIQTRRILIAIRIVQTTDMTGMIVMVGGVIEGMDNMSGIPGIARAGIIITRPTKASGITIPPDNASR
jgi:hypothetical protein